MYTRAKKEKCELLRILTQDDVYNEFSRQKEGAASQPRLLYACLEVL